MNASVVKKKKKLKEITKVNEIKAFLKKDYFLEKTWGNIMEKKGRADLTGIEKKTGIKVEIEVKLKRSEGGKEPTKEQKKRLQLFAKYKAIASCTNSPEKALIYIECPLCQKIERGNICFHCGKEKD